MVKSDTKEKSYYATRTAIGGLYKSVTFATDPAHRLSFSSDLTNNVRSALIQRIEDKVPDSDLLPDIFNGLLKAIARQYPLDPLEIQTIDNRINEIFKSDAQAKYGGEMYRDLMFVNDIHKLWSNANMAYIQTPASWTISNGMLHELHKQLFEIIIRHDLAVLPRGEFTSIDDRGESMAKLMAAMNES